jgi:hypothetical protein
LNEVRRRIEEKKEMLLEFTKQQMAIKKLIERNYE